MQQVAFFYSIPGKATLVNLNFTTCFNIMLNYLLTISKYLLWWMQPNMTAPVVMDNNTMEDFFYVYLFLLWAGRKAQ